MNAVQRAIAIPPRKIIMQRAARRKVIWNVAPLAAGAQDVHDTIHDCAHIRPSLAAAAFSGRYQRLDMRPFLIRQVARISQMVAVVLGSVFVRPHRRPPLRIKAAFIESQVIQLNQEVSGRTLSICASRIYDQSASVT